MRRLFPVTDQTAPAAAPAPQAQSEGRSEAPAHVADLVDREWTLDELAEAYAYPAPLATPGTPAASDAPHRWLRANMVSTLDGAAQHDGRSQAISSDADMRIFGTLRGLADVVIAGAETVRLEGYRPARARDAFAARRAADGQAPAPAIAVVSASLNLDFSLPLFTSPLVPTLVLTGAAASPDRVRDAEKAGARVIVAGDGPGVEPDRAVAALADMGLVRQLTEGGPRLLGQFAAAGVLDELCLTVAPLLTVGSAQRITGGPVLPDPERFALAAVLEEAGFLFTRYRRI
ncbi:pyrimidine reductase family protein [Streptomyces niveus]|uniref:pyrimidine reductase family protein n=1 Tax=Streptomyces niveus TaxID=193462 RepID=UPI00365C3AF8